MTKWNCLYLVLLALAVCSCSSTPRAGRAQNPIIHADVPDMSMVRVGDTYYMSSTTMHMNPGVPIMKSTDLVNWEIVSYCHDALADIDELNLDNDRNTYGRGTWASCIRHHNNTFYVTTFAQTTNKTYIFSSPSALPGTWKMVTFSPSYHDHTVFFDDDGRTYMIWGGGRLNIVELNDDLTGVKEGTQRVLIENASAPSGDNVGLPAEGSQLFKVAGKYYLFNITWPKGGMRTVVVHRADSIDGEWEGRVVLQDKGVAQGGLIDTPDGKWFAYLFRDSGAVGRIPYLVPVEWKDGWCVLGTEGIVPDTLDLPASKGLMPGIVSSDEFDRKDGDEPLPLVWQWNHNPDNSLWTLNARKGHLRFSTNRTDNDFLQARNTLTQRTIGPRCSATISLDVSGMNEGDFAGLSLLQRRYGLVGVKYENGAKRVVMISAQSEQPEEIESQPLLQDVVLLKAECDFTDLNDKADFYFSTDGTEWTKIGNQLSMAYTLPHFMGYRYGLYYYSTLTAGGYVDFDYFRISQE